MDEYCLSLEQNGGFNLLTRKLCNFHDLNITSINASSRPGEASFFSTSLLKNLEQISIKAWEGVQILFKYYAFSMIQ